MGVIMTGKVMWSYPEELNDAGLVHVFAGLLSFVPPLHHHTGEIALIDNQIVIEGDTDLTIPFGNIEQIYLGFDDVYRSTYVKNNGLFWQPLRLTFNTLNGTQVVYLIIDHNFIGARNKDWYQMLTDLYQR